MEDTSEPERCSPADRNRFQADKIGNLKIQLVPPLKLLEADPDPKKKITTLQ